MATLAPSAPVWDRDVFADTSRRGEGRRLSGGLACILYAAVDLGMIFHLPAGLGLCHVAPRKQTTVWLACPWGWHRHVYVTKSVFFALDSHL